MSATIDDETERSGYDFIDEPQLHGLLGAAGPPPAELGDVIAKSMAKESLSVEETAVLLAADDAGSVQRIFAAARQLKRNVYGNRIVLFAPLYVGNECTNDCQYCGFRRSNPEEVRRTLDDGRPAGPGRGPGKHAATSGRSSSSASIRSTSPSTSPKGADGLFGQGRSRRNPPREHQRRPDGP